VGASALFVSALGVVIGAGPLYDEVAAGEIRDELTKDSLDWPQALLAEQDRIAEDVVKLLDRVLNGVVGEGLLLLVASGALIVVSAVWARKKDPESPVADSRVDAAPPDGDTNGDEVPVGASDSEHDDGAGEGSGASPGAPWRR